jgi:hypothetical protein
LFFSVFIIINSENKVSVKYKTKNIKTDGKVVFLAKINQTRANNNSSRNLRPIETNVNKVWLSGSLVCPFKKITRVIMAITEKRADSTGISVNGSFSSVRENIRNPAPAINIFNNRSNDKYLKRGFK